jgi:hypothetical protein
MVCDLITTEGLSFQVCPSSLAAEAPVPVVAIPPIPFAPVKFSGLMLLLLASDNLYNCSRLFCALTRINKTMAKHNTNPLFAATGSFIIVYLFY